MRFRWFHGYTLFGAMCAGKAAHWFITPAAYSASGFQQFAVAAQLIAGVILIVIGVRQSRRSSASGAAGA